MERLEALVDGMIALENDARRRNRALHFGQCFGIIEKVISRLVSRNSVDNIVKNPLIFYKHKCVYKLEFAPDTVPATLVYCHKELRDKWTRYFEKSHDVIVVLEKNRFADSFPKNCIVITSTKPPRHLCFARSFSDKILQSSTVSWWFDRRFDSRSAVSMQFPFDISFELRHFDFDDDETRIDTLGGVYFDLHRDLSKINTIVCHKSCWDSIMLLLSNLFALREKRLVVVFRNQRAHIDTSIDFDIALLRAQKEDQSSARNRFLASIARDDDSTHFDSSASVSI
jgi:hypothetical protein